MWFVLKLVSLLLWQVESRMGSERNVFWNLVLDSLYHELIFFIKHYRPICVDVYEYVNLRLYIIMTTCDSSLYFPTLLLFVIFRGNGAHFLWNELDPRSFFI